MSNAHYQQQLAELEELARETTNLLDDIVTEEDYSVIEPDISDLDDRDPIPDEEWFSPVSYTADRPDQETLAISWGVYLATRSGYGEAALAYLTMNGGAAFIKRCRTELLPHFNQVTSPLIPSGKLIGPFWLEGEVNSDDCD